MITAEELYKKLVYKDGLWCNDKDYFIDYTTKNTTYSLLKASRVCFNSIIEKNKDINNKIYSGIFFDDFVYASNANFRLHLSLNRLLNSLEHDIKSFINQTYHNMSDLDKRELKNHFKTKRISHTSGKCKVEIGTGKKRIIFNYCQPTQANRTRNFYDIYAYCTFGELLRFFYYYFDNYNDTVFYSVNTQDNETYSDFKYSSLDSMNLLRNKVYHGNLVFNRSSDNNRIEDTSVKYKNSISYFMNYLNENRLSLKNIDLDKLEDSFKDNRFNFSIFYTAYTAILLLKRIEYNSSGKKGDNKTRLEYVKEDVIAHFTGFLNNVKKMKNRDKWVDDMTYVVKSCCKLFENNC